MANKYIYERVKGETYHEHMERMGRILQTRMLTPLNVVVPEIEKTDDNLVWKNFHHCCESIMRDKEHVYYYFTGEMLQNMNSEELKLPTKFTKLEVIKLYKTYLNEFVTCCMCKSNKSILEKEMSNRFYILYCASCYCVIPVEKVPLFPV